MRRCRSVRITRAIADEDAAVQVIEVAGGRDTPVGLDDQSPASVTGRIRRRGNYAGSLAVGAPPGARLQGHHRPRLSSHAVAIESRAGSYDATLSAW